MSMWTDLTEFVAERLIFMADRKKPDRVLRRADGIYLERWFIIRRNSFFNIYLHKFHLSDDARAHHDHEYISATWMLRGSYLDCRILSGGRDYRHEVKTADLYLRPWPSEPHRIELHKGVCWTLFITGPRVRKWGFHCPNGWRPWDEFTDPNDYTKPGPGCGD